MLTTRRESKYFPSGGQICWRRRIFYGVSSGHLVHAQLFSLGQLREGETPTAFKDERTCVAMKILSPLSSLLKVAHTSPALVASTQSLLQNGQDISLHTPRPLAHRLPECARQLLVVCSTFGLLSVVFLRF